VITGVARRRRFPMDQKLAIVAGTMQPGMSISYVARRHGLSPSLGIPVETADERRRQGSHSSRDRQVPAFPREDRRRHICKSPVPTLSNGATALARCALLRTVLVTSIWLPTSAASSTSGPPMAMTGSTPGHHYGRRYGSGGGYGGCWLLSLARKLAGLFRGLPLAERAIQA